MPACYEPWQTVYGLFRRWQRAGVWQQIVSGLQARADAVGLITWDVSVDSTIARGISTPPAPAASPSCRWSRRAGSRRSQPIMRWCPLAAG
ncbi:hypothetical protein MILUP08_45510 [Micromonospora lupini str. Lupac 08]|uniref:Transposase n=1 Tax=Micromonospora lupini str. Lupac 08 TaxID=1150864 RepID=I0L9X9_9ACTN|nr:hypothetical protein MILUP08_45510 [Micromonospora lupini str. Lupac 08]